MKSWQVLKLHEICVIRSGILTSKNNCTSPGRGIPYVKPRDIYFNTIIYTDEQVSESFLMQQDVEIIPKESILIAASGSNAGNLALLGEDAVLNQQVFSTTIHNPVVTPKFLYYYLFFKKNLLINTSRHTSRVSYRHLQKLDIPLPTLKEQHQIIKYLDTNLFQINFAINKTKQALLEIQGQKADVLNIIFSHKGGLFCDRMENLHLNDLGIIKAGNTPNGAMKHYFGSFYPLFKPADLHQGNQLQYAGVYLSLQGLKIARYVKAKSLLVCTSGSNFGKVGLTQVDGACNQQIISFTPNDKLIPEYIYFQMNSDNFKQEMLRCSKKNLIRVSDFKNLSLWVTTLSQQQKIINNITHKISLIAKNEMVLNRKLTYLDHAKLNVLSRSFTKKDIR